MFHFTFISFVIIILYLIIYLSYVHVINDVVVFESKSKEINETGTVVLESGLNKDSSPYNVQFAPKINNNNTTTFILEIKKEKQKVSKSK